MWTCKKCGTKIDDHLELCWSCGTSVDGVEDPTFQADAVKADGPPIGSPMLAVPRPNEELVTIAAFDLLGRAHLARMVLEEEGIPVMLADENTVSTDWLLSNAVGGIKVQVYASDVERAKRLLAEHHAEPKPLLGADE